MCSPQFICLDASSNWCSGTEKLKRYLFKFMGTSLAAWGPIDRPGIVARAGGSLEVLLLELEDTGVLSGNL